MKYEVHDDLILSMRYLRNHGGPHQKAAERVAAVLTHIREKEPDPLKGLRITKHGESRVEHCVKYDLNDFCRLITVEERGICALLFVGKHDDCDQWLRRNKGYRLMINEAGELEGFRKSKSLHEEDGRISSVSDLSEGKLFKRLPERYYDRIADGVKRTTLRSFEDLESTASEEDIQELAYRIEDEDLQLVFFDVFSELRGGDVHGAKQTIDVYINSKTLVSTASQEQLKSLTAGDSFVDAEMAADLFEHFVKTADYRTWMLFMGREQREVVRRDFLGPARLSGVSGSGKTCVVINRAIRLAREYQGSKILVLTLNRSLARMIDDLMDYACVQSIRPAIEVMSFWELCQSELELLEPDRFEKYYNDVTWKRGEHIGDIWDEFYDVWHQRDFNNLDAQVLRTAHQTLLARGIFPKEYIRQEFDWVRSALPREDRAEYLKLERVGRKVPLTPEYREQVLEGLQAWEKKMEDVGVIDYIGLAVALHGHLPEIRPRYRCVLVDEAQDFGTIELAIVRRLVEPAGNDIFLSGDVAQRVNTKAHELKKAGIEINSNSITIKQNYRNSREILSAAYAVLESNSPKDATLLDDFEVLEPEYANYSTPKPMCLHALTLDEEFGRSLHYLRRYYDLMGEKKACIALCGYSFREVKRIGRALKLPVLDGSVGLDDGYIFLSDLEQTKGFEFDTICIVNCNHTIIPDSELPEEEWYRDLSKFYVAMTRAKRELILSYSYAPSMFVQNCKGAFIFGEFSDYETDFSLEGFELPRPEKSKPNKEILELNGEEFLYTEEAIGASNELQNKLLSLVTGRDVRTGSRRTEWRSIGEVVNCRTVDRPLVAQAFGPKVFTELQELMKAYVNTPAVHSE